jgi:hypothetical protein
MLKCDILNAPSRKHKDLRTALADIHGAVADCELEVRAAGAGAGADGAFRDAGFLA